VTNGSFFAHCPPAVDGLTVLAAGGRDLTVAIPDETRPVAVDRRLRRRAGRVPLINHDDPRHLVGYLVRTGHMEVR
jgi:hypothetical protein